MRIPLVALFVLSAGTAAANAPEPTLELVGATAYSVAQVRAGIASSEEPFRSDTGSIDTDAVDREMMLIASFYYDRGHVQVDVGKWQYDAGRNVITVPVTEGPVFRISAIHVKGDLLGTEQTHLAKLHVRPGAIFSRRVIADDILAMRTAYENRAYAYVNVMPLTKLDTAKNTIAITIEIQRGKQATFEKIEIDGNTKTPEAEIRKLVPAVAGDPYSTSALEEAKRKLLATGKFQRVDLVTKHGSSDTQVIATIEVEE